MGFLRILKLGLQLRKLGIRLLCQFFKFSLERLGLLVSGLRCLLQFFNCSLITFGLLLHLYSHIFDPLI